MRYDNSKGRRGLIVEAMAIYALNVVDLVASAVWIRTYGMEAEANPIGRRLFNTGIASPYKLILCGLALALIVAHTSKKPEWRWTLHLLLAVFLPITVLHAVILTTCFL